MRRSYSLWLVVACTVFVAMFLLFGCEENFNQPLNTATPAVSSAQKAPLSKSDSRVQALMRVQERHTQRLMQSKDVVGTAVGQNDAGELVVKIYTVKEGVPGLPATLDGEKVEVEVTGVIHAMGGAKPGKGTPSVSHTTKQTPPIQLGTSGGYGYDLANGYCCGGTLGSLVSIGNKLYILSNYHVFESDIVSGGNDLVAKNGDPIIQPGLIDVGCNYNNAQPVASLFQQHSLPRSNVDCSVAEVASGQVRTDGAILEIGTLSASTLPAALNLAVKKSGRTTGLTHSTIVGLNATISVAYDNECAGGAAFTKVFTGQIVILNRGSRFLNSGDSGSLMVEDVATNPRAVGLLFAGGGSTAIANPIDEVLTFLGAKMVGVGK